MWIDIRDKKPDDYQTVFVKLEEGWEVCGSRGVLINYGVATYSPHLGFEADSSAYDITMDDDSGFRVTLCGSVSYWMPIP